QCPDAGSHHRIRSERFTGADRVAVAIECVSQSTTRAGGLGAVDGRCTFLFGAGGAEARAVRAWPQSIQPIRVF
ncbi:MAG: hypothetical protein AAB093_04885, partial [Nitrospirota bacterium]